jgi:hypothetical protein
VRANEIADVSLVAPAVASGETRSALMLGSRSGCALDAALASEYEFIEALSDYDLLRAAVKRLDHEIAWCMAIEVESA